MRQHLLKWIATRGLYIVKELLRTQGGILLEMLCGGGGMFTFYTVPSSCKLPKKASWFFHKFKAQLRVSLTVPNCDQIAQVSQTILYFFECNRKS